MSRRQPARRRSASTGRRRWLGWLVRLVLLPPLLWLAGLMWFAFSLPQPMAMTVRTDAVVVLTGGPGRLARGLAVLQAGSARRMLLSGVDRTVNRRQVAKAAGVPRERLDTTDFGYQAVDTRSNAEETAAWVARNGFASIRVVTASAHMRRSLMELRQVLPKGVQVVADGVPVPLKPVSIGQEYSKFLLRRCALWAGAQ